MTTVALSLVMCTLGRRDCLPRLLDSLVRQTCQDFELLVVDQNPPGYLDAFIAQASACIRVVYLRSLPGLSRARNVGMACAQGRLIAFPDDDCWYPPGLVAEVVDRFARQPQLQAITCRTVDAQGRDSNGSFLQATADIARHNVWRAGNSNGLFVRTALALQLGGFNEQLGVGAGTAYGSGEESDFLLRALAHGAAMRYVHDMHTHHDQVDAVLDDRTLRRAQLYARGYGRTLRLNHFSPTFAMLRSVRSTASAVLALCALNPRRARFKGIWAAGILAGYLARQ